MTVKKDTRTRNWCFVQYDDSSPEEWRDILSSYLIPWYESPLHDKDKNPDGTIKKSHRHIVLTFEGKKSYEQVLEICKSINATIPQPVHNMVGMIRYLTHKDNPEKYQYDEKDILCHCGADLEIYTKLSSSDERVILKELYKFIRNNDFQSYSDLVDYCIESDRDDFFDLITKKYTLAISSYIKSYAYKHTEIDKETGEHYYVGDFLNKRK